MTRRPPSALLSALLTPALLAVAVASAALGLARGLTPLRVADEVYADMLTAHLSPAEPQHAGIALVTFGEESVAEAACRSPLDRGRLVEIVDALAKAGVAAIGIDVLFDQPTLREEDERLRRRILGAGVPVVAVSALPGTPLTARQRSFLDRFLEGVPYGHANLSKDVPDGTVRWHAPVAPDGTPSFPARLAAMAGAAVPAAPFRIAWRPPPDDRTPPFPTYPAEAVPLLPAEWLKGRIVLIGTMLGGIDHHLTPLSRRDGSTAGAAIQAHVLAQLLDGRAAPHLTARGQVPAAGVLAALGVGLAMAGLPMGLLGVVCLTLLAALWAASAGLYAAGGPLVPLMAPSLALVAGIAAMAAHLSLRERTDRRTLMHLFAKHVAQPVAEDIWRNRAAFLSGGRPRPQQLTATVLFSDIEGFTTVCESLEPDALIGWLEEYLEAMVRVVGAHDGIVLRFVGDAVLAAFGVPVARRSQAEIDRDAESAVRCALAMGRELEELNRRWAEAGLPIARVRVGIHTGPLVAGSLGGLRHMEYSLLGDTANTAARLEEHAKTIAATSSRYCRIVVGEPTWRAVRGTLAALPVGDLVLRGKRTPVSVWLVLDPNTQLRGRSAALSGTNG